jgi:SAM-dependent methyltransferase
VTGLSRQYCKLCDLPDFEDPALIARMREIQPEPDPATHIERKLWEEGMLALFLEDAGVLDDRSEVLAVGAGKEPLLYWLANRVGRVVATDIYGEGEFAGREAEGSMLDDPSAFAPFEYRQDRLEARFMDARELDFEDGSFDAVYTLSSIEHFGSPADIKRAASEIGRVLRPGGVAFIVTELLVRLHPLDTAPVDFARRVATLNRHRSDATLLRRSYLDDAFKLSELRRRIIRASGLHEMQPLDLTLSPSSWDNLASYGKDMKIVTPSGSFYPHILLQVSRSVFTSVALALQKPL